MKYECGLSLLSGNAKKYLESPHCECIINSISWTYVLFRKINLLLDMFLHSYSSSCLFAVELLVRSSCHHKIVKLFVCSGYRFNDMLTFPLGGKP